MHGGLALAETFAFDNPALTLCLLLIRVLCYRGGGMVDTENSPLQIPSLQQQLGPHERQASHPNKYLARDAKH